MGKTLIAITSGLLLILAYLVSVKLMYRNESGIHGQTIWIFAFATIACFIGTAIVRSIDKQKM